MEFKISLSHVALLVPSVDAAAEFLRSLGFPQRAPDLFKETREIYVGDLTTHSSTLLLMEPAGEGSYTKALQKRGPGLHHIAVDVLNLESYIQSISNSGWLLHPKSLQMMKDSQTAYLCRPGVPTLIELQEKTGLDENPMFVEAVQIPGLSEKELGMFRTLGLKTVSTGAAELLLTVAGQQVRFGDLCRV
jgi:hypothetical protein